MNKYLFGSVTLRKRDSAAGLGAPVSERTDADQDRGFSKRVRPELLGVVGEEHLRRLCESAGGEIKSFKYFLSPGRDAGGLPYVVEIATCPFKQWVSGKEDTRRGRGLITGVNFSATLENPFQTFRGMEGLEEILAELRAGSGAPVIVCVHYACPRIEYLDRGKSRIGLE
jgi:hypothetical protein